MMWFIRVLMIPLMVAFTSQFALSQPLEVEWSRTYGGADWDECHYVRQTTDGGYILGGRSCSWGAGNGDFLLLKTDSEGEVEWNRTYGGPMYERSRCARQTSDGGFIIAGCTQSWGAGSYDTWAVKTDSNGDTIWTMLFGGTSEDRLTAVHETRDKGYIFTGYTYSFGPSGRNALAIKANYFGEIIWWQAYGGNGDDFFLDVCETENNDFVFVGATTSFGLGGYDFYLVTTDVLGDEQWHQTYGGGGGDQCFNILPTADNSYILHGPTGSFGAGDRDFWLIEIQPDGQELWNQTYGGSSYEWGCVVERTPDNGFVMFGETMSFGSGDRDFWIVKTDRQGEQEWAMPFGGPSLDITWCGQPTFDGGYIVAGYTSSFGAGSMDVLLVKLSVPTPECWPDHADLLPQELDFGVVSVGEGSTASFAIENSDTCDLIINSVIAPDGFSVSFNGPVTISQDQSVTVQVEFSPTEVREYSGVITVHTNADEEIAELPVHGIGGGAAIELEPTELVFNDVGVGSSLTLGLTIRSVGTTNLIVGNVYAPVPFSTDFSEALVIPPHESRTVNVTFAPDTLQSYEDILVVVSNIPQSTSVVNLYGNAIPGTSTDDILAGVSEYSLNGVYPNPFNPSTTISFDVPKVSEVSVVVYDITGRRVSELLNGTVSAGQHQLNWSCSECAAGMYMVTMTSGEFRAVTKALFVK